MFRQAFLYSLLVELACAGMLLPHVATATGGRQPLIPALPISLSASSSQSAYPAVATAEATGAGGKGKSPLRYRITHWTVKNGLPQNAIQAIVQTRDGYLWLGTLKGLARFDGVRFKVFDYGNTPKMTHDSISDLVEDTRDGGLWIGTLDSLLYYRDRRFVRYDAEDGLTDAANDLYAAREGGVWLRQRPGHVALCRNGMLKNLQFGPNDPEHAVYQIGEANASELLIRFGRLHGHCAVHRFDLNTRSLSPLDVPTTAGNGQPNCYSFLQATDGSLWLCRSDGIWRRSGQVWKRIVRTEPESKLRPYQMYQTRDGRFWVTQFDGRRATLYRLVGGRLERFVAPEFPANLNVTKLLEDHEGNLWVGSKIGLFRLEPRQLRLYSSRDGMSNDETLAVAEGTDGTIWVGTEDGVSAIRDGKVENLVLPQAGVKSKPVAVFVTDQENALWMGRTGPVGPILARYQRGRWETFPAPRELPQSGDPSAMYEDREGRMWIGTSQGVLCQEHGQWTYLTTTNGLSNRDVRVIHQDRRGELWFGTFGGGLNRLHDGKFTAYKTGGSEANNRAWWIYEDAEGVFWVGTEDGLNRFVPPGVRSPGPSAAHTSSNKNRDEVSSRFFTFTTQQGLAENVVNNIQEDQFGNLWLSGLRGIYRVARQQLNEVAAGRRAKVECTAYDEADGMLNSECNGGDNQPAGCKDQNGRIWFPTMQGVVMIDPKEMQRTESPPPVVIEQVKANEGIVFGDGTTNEDEKPEIEGQRLQLPPGHARVLEIHYTANCLSAPERVTFKYRLEGHDRDWQVDNQNRRVAFYTNLRPGDYTFRVMACSPHGVWNTHGDQFAFHIAPHFYETWLFLVGSGAFVMLATFGLHHQRIRGLRQLQRLEQQRVLQEERARIAKDLHDDLGANLTGLALQLDLVSSQSHAADEQQHRLATLAHSTRAMVDNMREVVWAMNPQHDNVESFANFLGQYTEQFLTAAGLRCRLELSPRLPAQPLGSHTRHQLFLVVKEALNNIVRHAHAHEVRLRLDQQPDELRLTLDDDGRGLPPDGVRVAQHGLDNMKQRITNLGGNFSVSNRPEQGTRVAVRLPLRQTIVSDPPS
jgi:signal transduction histidine kinase/ligand-binding sensor domain-containing protein